MSRVSLHVIVVCSLLACPVQNALGQSNEARWFSTFQYGTADYDVALTGDASWWGNVDDDGDSFAIGFGYDALPQLGLRLMYEQSGGIAATNRCPDDRICPAVSFREATTADSWSLVAMPRMRFGASWELYGTAGAMHWRIDPEGEISRDRGTDLLYGGGLGYRFENNLGVALEYQQSSTDYDALRLNASFAF